MKNRINKERLTKNISKSASDKRINIVLSPSLVVLATYLLLLVSKLVDVTLLNRDNEYMSIIILQIMIFVLPATLWCRLNGERYVKSLRLNLFGPDSILLVLSAAVMSISGGILLSMLFSGVDSVSESFTLYDTFISKNDGSVSDALYLTLAFAALPAVCEEFIFRGILCHEYEKGGVHRAIFFSSFFFALLHFSPRNIPTYLFCGGVLCLVMYASRSVIASMIVHFLYNLFGIFGAPYISRLYVLTGSSRLIIFIMCAAFLSSLALFSGAASNLYRKHLRSGASSNYKNPMFVSSEEIKSAYFEIIKDPYTVASVAVYIITVVLSLIFGG